MRICVPSETDEGLLSRLCGHFGSAPCFMIYDTRRDAIDVIYNTNESRIHDACSPLSVIKNHKIDVVLCKGIGSRALSRLRETGIKVYKSNSLTFQDALDEFSSDNSEGATSEGACTNHSCRKEAKNKTGRFR